MNNLQKDNFTNKKPFILCECIHFGDRTKPGIKQAGMHNANVLLHFAIIVAREHFITSIMSFKLCWQSIDAGLNEQREVYIH